MRSWWASSREARAMYADFTPAWGIAIDGFIEWIRAGGAPATTAYTRRQHLEHLARRAPGEPWQLTTDDLLEYVSGQDWAVETRRGRRSTFTLFYDVAIARGLTDSNPAKALPRVRATRPTPRPVPEPVYEAAMLAADETLRLVLRLAHDAGLRRAEIAKVHSDDIFQDLTGWSLRVHGKGNRARVVPLSARLAFELRALPAGWALPGNDGGHLSPRWIGKLSTRVLSGPYTLHTLRHSFASRAYGAARDLAVVQDLLGHASPATTRTYVAMPNDALRNVVDAIA